MKCNKKTTAIYLCLTIVMASLLFSGCGKSKSGGGGEVVTTKKWYQDNDEDGFGNADNSRNADKQPKGYVDNSGDCDDTNKFVNPGVVEIVEDGIDNNCNGKENETPPRVIPDTNQTVSYTETPGEDSDFLIDGPSYTKLDENGQELEDNAVSWKMVRDNVTKLIWEMKNAKDQLENYNNIHDADNTYTWEKATSVFIAKLNEDNFGNFNDGFSWRLPTIQELSYITDCSRADIRIATNYFNVLTNNGVWSSTPNTDPTTEAWCHYPYYGMMYSKEKTIEYGVWAVRGKENVSELEKYSSDIVQDKTTGLMWQSATGKNEDDAGMSYEDALEYCENLELGGFKDWRLPNKNELMSLTRFELESPTIARGFFSDMESGGFWTSTSFVKSDGSNNLAWAISFKTGVASYANKSGEIWVRAVRGGNNTSTKTWYKDEDLDGYGNPANYKKIDSSLPKPDGYVDNVLGYDCNDGKAGINPAAYDIPNDTIDQNCSGRFNYTWYLDSDGDLYGDGSKLPIEREIQPTGYVRSNTDCNDSNKSVKPGMIDLADDGLDNDCNGQQNVSWYVDSDNDGYGDRDQMRVVVSEMPPAVGHHVSNNLDCADDNPDIRPGLIEIFGNTNDSNCNGDINDMAQSIIPDTSQIGNYSGNYGEDSDFMINRPTYTKYDINGNELDDTATDWVVIKDEVTGLYWEVKTEANMEDPYTYDAAVTYAANLNLAKFHDWRLPTVTELATIAHMDMTDPAINPAVFPFVTSYQYWTATDLGSEDTAMTVNFQRGESGVFSKLNTYFVIAVRENITGRLIANGDGTVTDTRTGLIWNDTHTTNDTWENSVSGWAGEVDAGYNDWRLPTESEMAMFVEILLGGVGGSSDIIYREGSTYGISIVGSTLDFSLGVFDNITFTGNSFWTSTLALTDPAKAVVYSFLAGENAGISFLSVQKTLVNKDAPPAVPSLSGIGVRGVKQNRFITNDDGTVFDTKTGLMWAGNNGASINFEVALNHCNTMTLAGHDDWRLPNRNEMLSLLSAYLEDSSGYLDAFPDSVNSYWSSTSRFDVTGDAWRISFKTGEISVTLGAKTDPNVFRAVRGGDIE